MPDPGYVTSEIRNLIGVRSAKACTRYPVEHGEVRRFHQATMDPARRYWDEEWAGRSRYGVPVAPPAFPIHAFRLPSDAPDPLASADGEDFDGYNRALRPGLPPIDLPLKRLLNGGYEYEFFRYVEIGERVCVVSTYRDIFEKTGRNGSLVFIVVEDEYSTEAGHLLLRCTNTLILR